jgi:cytochrome c oxidase subunit II
MRTAALASSIALAGCSGPLSALDPAGPHAASVAQLWWVMLFGATAILLVVMVLLLRAFMPFSRSPASPRRWLLGGGIVFPVVTLTALLSYALATGERLLARQGVPEVVRVEVLARQWQWEISHPLKDGATARTIGTLHIPAGMPIDIHVASADVIHSFWIPRLGGKIDAVPGHVNVIRLTADTPGSYRGICAEFCGSGHAGMEMAVVAHAPEDYAAMLAQIAADSQTSDPRADPQTEAAPLR